ncbi:MAG: hypothetical protein AABY16_03045 [Nanoarchaeota archaeon]
MEKQVLLNQKDYNDLPYNRNKFATLNKQEQAEFMKRKLSLILRQCEEMTKNLNDDTVYLEKPKH